MGRLSRGALAGVAAAAVLAAGCTPKSVSEAEDRDDVAWLAANASPEALQALGHVADKDPAAQKALSERATSNNDVNVYLAAWAAVLRNAPWGTVILRDAIADTQRADTAATAMARRDPHLAAFSNALEAALVRGGTKVRNLTVAALLASTGPAAHDAVVRRLADASTRGAMCRGLTSPEASDDAKKTLLTVEAGSRDDADCVDAVVRVAAHDDQTLAWLAQIGEPGILAQAGKSEVIPCPRLAQLWTEAVHARPTQTLVVLALPLAESVKRCPAALDPVLASTVTKSVAGAELVVGAVDPVGTETTELRSTCSALPLVLRGAAPPPTKQRAADAVARGCKNATKAR